MANRHTLAIHKLEEFKQWLDLVGVEHRPTTDDYQVLQVRLPNDPRWHAVFQKLSAKEHLSVPEPLVRLVRAFVSGSDTYEALGQVTGMSRGEAEGAGLRTRYTAPFPNLMQVPRIPMNRCCEKAVPLGVAVCPDCLETADAYGSQSTLPDDTPPWE